MAISTWIDPRNCLVLLPNPLFPYREKDSIAVRTDVVRVEAGWEPLTARLGEFFRPNFESRNPLNIPGPFYGAETDTCETGVREAPNNVLMDEHGREFICRQPGTPEELRDVLSAAICECFTGFGADGDTNWTLPLIRDWWGNRFDFLRNSVLAGNDRAILGWREMLSGGAEAYLRSYAFFVEEGRRPTERDHLPIL